MRHLEIIFRMINGDVQVFIILTSHPPAFGKSIELLRGDVVAVVAVFVVVAAAAAVDVGAVVVVVVAAAAAVDVGAVVVVVVAAAAAADVDAVPPQSFHPFVLKVFERCLLRLKLASIDRLDIDSGLGAQVESINFFFFLFWINS